jgi:peroxiredoxin
VEKQKAQFDQRGASIVVVSFAEPAKLASYHERHPWPFTILSDLARDGYREFALKRLSWWRVFSPATLMLYWRLRRSGAKAEAYGEKDDIYQSGGDFILDHDGRLLFAHRSREPADRPAVSRLLETIDEAESCNQNRRRDR